MTKAKVEETGETDEIVEKVRTEVGEIGVRADPGATALQRAIGEMTVDVADEDGSTIAPLMKKVIKTTSPKRKSLKRD